MPFDPGLCCGLSWDADNLARLEGPSPGAARCAFVDCSGHWAEGCLEEERLPFPCAGEEELVGPFVVRACLVSAADERGFLRAMARLDYLLHLDLGGTYAVAKELFALWRPAGS